MATKIRLARFGRKKKPFYRIIVADSRSPRDGRHLEIIGFYDPLTDPVTLNIKREKAIYWLNNGAKPSQTVRNLMSGEGILLEHDLRTNGKSEDEIKEELQKFEFVREQKLKRADAEKKQSAQAKAKTEEKAPEAPVSEEAAAEEDKPEEKPEE